MSAAAMKGLELEDDEPILLKGSDAPMSSPRLRKHPSKTELATTMSPADKPKTNPSQVLLLMIPYFYSCSITRSQKMIPLR